MNYTIKFQLSDLYLQEQSHNNGLSEQGILNNRCQQDKKTPAPCSIQSPQGVNDKLQGSVLHPDPHELLQQHMSK